MATHVAWYVTLWIQENKSFSVIPYKIYYNIPKNMAKYFKFITIEQTNLYIYCRPVNVCRTYSDSIPFP